MNSVKISVIIPVYNSARFIERTLASVLNQTYLDKEIIVIDDGSTDETPKILEKFRKDIIYVRTVNKGVASALNEGVGHARGEWAAFLDHDDLWFKNKLETKMQCLEKYPHAKIICCDFIFRHSFFRRLMRNYRDYWKIFQDAREVFLNDVFELILEGCFIGTFSAAMIRLDLIKRKGPFNPDYRIGVDHEFWIRCLADTGILYVNEALVYKRVHSGNLSIRIDSLFEQMKILREAETFHPSRFKNRKTLKKYKFEKAKLNYQIGNTYFELSQKREGFRYYLKGMRCSGSFENLSLFFWILLKKILRVLTRDFSSRKNLKSLFQINLRR